MSKPEFELTREEIVKRIYAHYDCIERNIDVGSAWELLVSLQSQLDYIKLYLIDVRSEWKFEIVATLKQYHDLMVTMHKLFINEYPALDAYKEFVYKIINTKGGYIDGIE